jgi:2-keto-4-pentenoate hydratase/2-oxohepta-3-ene-1,7-dioic acid hydratase in catechol pathway
MNREPKFFLPAQPLSTLTHTKQGELVFVTSRECRDITPDQAHEYILGYTVGNDLSCRFFQLPEQSGGQFFYAKAFDKFAPIEPERLRETASIGHARDEDQRGREAGYGDREGHDIPAGEGP